MNFRKNTIIQTIARYNMISTPGIAQKRDTGLSLQTYIHRRLWANRPRPEVLKEAGSHHPEDLSLQNFRWPQPEFLWASQ